MCKTKVPGVNSRPYCENVGNKLIETYPDHVANSTIGQSTYGQIQFVYDLIGRTVVRADEKGRNMVPGVNRDLFSHFLRLAGG